MCSPPCSGRASPRTSSRGGGSGCGRRRAPGLRGRGRPGARPRGRFPAGRRSAGSDSGRVQQHHRRPPRLSPGRRRVAGAPRPRRPHQPPARAEQGGLHAAAAAAGVAVAVPVGGGLGRVRGHRRGTGAVVLPRGGAASGGDALRVVRPRVADVLRLRRVGLAARGQAGGMRVEEPCALRPAGLPTVPRRRRDPPPRTVLAGQRRGRPPRRGGGADGGGHSADADLSLPHRAAPDGGRRGLAAPEPVGAGVAPVLFPVGLDARRGAVRGGRGGRARHPGGHRGAGPAHARRPEGAARPRPLPPPVARHRRRPAGGAGPARLRPGAPSARCSASSPGWPPRGTTTWSGRPSWGRCATR